MRRHISGVNGGVGVDKLLAAYAHAQLVNLVPIGSEVQRERVMRAASRQHGGTTAAETAIGKLDAAIPGNVAARCAVHVERAARRIETRQAASNRRECSAGIL